MLTILRELITRDGFHTKFALIFGGDATPYQGRIVAADEHGVALTFDNHDDPKIVLYPWHMIAWINTARVTE